MSRVLPTEAQVLTGRMNDLAQQMVSELADLPDQLTALASWSPALKLTPEFLGHLQEMLKSARQMQFDALRLEYLVDDHAAEARGLYRHSMQMVDACRMGAATRPEAQPLADELLKVLTHVQETVEGWFPDESMPTGE